MRKVYRNVWLSVLGQALPLAVGLVAMPIVARSLGAERFGLLGIIWALLGALALFDFGLSRATTRFVASVPAGNPELLSRLTATATVIQVLLGVVGAGALWPLRPWLVDQVLGVPAALRAEALGALGTLLLALPVFLAGLVLRGALEGLGRFDLANRVRIPVGVATFLLPAVAAPLGAGLLGITMLLAATRVWALYAAARALRTAIPAWRWAPPRLALLSRLLTYGGWVTLSNVVSPVMVYGERFMLARLVGLSAVGYYTAPFEAITRLTFLASAAAAGLFPELSTLDAGGNRARIAELAWRATRYGLLVAVVPVLVVVFFAHDLLARWLGSSFATEATVALQVLAAGVLLNALAQVPYTVLHACGRPDLNAKFHLLELPLFLAGGWWLVARYGISGAAAAWGLRVALDTVLLFVGASRVLGAGPRWLWRDYRVFGAIAGLAGGLGIAVWIPGPLALRAAVACLIVVVFVWAVWQGLLDDAERRRIAGALAPNAVER